MSKTQDPLRIDYDGKWKILIEKAPKAFIEFFLSSISPQIDFQYPPKFMQQDVAKVVGSKRKKGDLVTDIIMEVRLLNGKKKLLYIHIKIQSTPTEAFGAKMFKPFYRLMDKYNEEVTALALFVGEYLPQNHDHYEYSFGETLVRYNYPTYIVKDQDKTILKASKNPFAIAVLACIYLIETRKSNSYTDRLLLKQELTAFIVDAVKTRAYDELTGLAIIDFVINIMILPKKLEVTYLNHCYKTYSNMEDRTFISEKTIAFADIFIKAAFQDSYANILQQLKEAKEDHVAKLKAEQEAKKAKEAKLKAEQEAKKAKLKAEQEAKKAKLKAEKLIIKLHIEQKLDIPTIANLLEEKEAYIKAVLAKHK